MKNREPAVRFLFENFRKYDYNGLRNIPCAHMVNRTRMPPEFTRKAELYAKGIDKKKNTVHVLVSTHRHLPVCIIWWRGVTSHSMCQFQRVSFFFVFIWFAHYVWLSSDRTGSYTAANQMKINRSSVLSDLWRICACLFAMVYLHAYLLHCRTVENERTYVVCDRIPKLNRHLDSD